MSDFGKRADGTPKGNGYFGVLKRPDGDVSTELSIGVNLGGKEMEIPSLVPTLSREEIDHLLQGGDVTPSIAHKASNFAVQRLKAGQPVWATPEEEGQTPIPAPTEEDFSNGFNSVRPQKQDAVPTGMQGVRG